MCRRRIKAILRYSCGQPKTESFTEADPLFFGLQKAGCLDSPGFRDSGNSVLKSCDQYLALAKILGRFWTASGASEGVGKVPGHTGCGLGYIHTNN